MRRFALLFGAFVVSIPITGCGSGGNASTATGSRADDPNLPAEVREYEAKDTKRAAERAAKKPPAKSGNHTTGKP